MPSSRHYNTKRQIWDQIRPYSGIFSGKIVLLRNGMTDRGQAWASGSGDELRLHLG